MTDHVTTSKLSQFLIIAFSVFYPPRFVIFAVSPLTCTSKDTVYWSFFLFFTETCNFNVIVLKQPKGYLNRGLAVNHTDGLQPYPPNQMCQWSVSYPAAKFISFTMNYLSLTANGDDTLQICPSNSSLAQCNVLQLLEKNSNRKFKVMGSKATIKFTSGDHVSFESRGWELSYSAGEANQI